MAGERGVTLALRRFQYRDDATVDDYLGALELGVLEDETRRSEKQRSGSAKAEVFGVGLGGDKGSLQAVESNLRQNAASKFEKLFRLMRDSEPKEFWDLDELDDDTWACLERGSLINLEVSITIPSVSRALGAAKDLGPLVTLMQAFTDTIDDETARQMTSLAQYGSSGGSEIASVVGASMAAGKYKFICKLTMANLLVPLESLEGTRFLFGQIEELIPPGQRELAVDMSGLGIMNREARRKMAKKAVPPDQRENFVTGPAAFVHVIAFYK